MSSTPDNSVANGEDVSTRDSSRLGIGKLMTAKEPTKKFSELDGKTRRFLAGALVTFFTTAILGVYLLPLAYMAVTSLKSEPQIARSTILPKSAVTIDYVSATLDLVETSDLDGNIQALTLYPEGAGGSTATPFIWAGDWAPLYDRLGANGASPENVSPYAVGSGRRAESGIALVLPTGDPSILLEGNVPTQLPFDHDEASMLAALSSAGYEIDKVALFSMPTVDDEIPALALMRPGAAVNALIDPRLLPSPVEWDRSYGGLERAVAEVLGVEAAEVQFFTMPDADGTLKGVGILPPSSDATVFLDPAITPPQAIEVAAGVAGLDALLDDSFDVSAQVLEIYKVPQDDGSTRELALLEQGPDGSLFVDPGDLGVEPILFSGAIQTLEPVLELDVNYSNFGDAAESIDFTNKLRNTAFIAGLGMAGTILSSTLVAYGLSRFRIPFKGLILGSLVATIILPRFVTLVPTYMLFERIGWVGTWWPLIVPNFFANAYNVFLLRQFFLTIPRDLDEAAAIDGASPLTTLLTVILPQARGAILAVALFHFFFAWNDFLEPLLYLSTEPDKQPISVGLYFFLGLYDSNIPLIQAGALLGMAIPILVFLVLQKVFLSGIDLSGSVK